MQDFHPDGLFFDRRQQNLNRQLPRDLRSAPRDPDPSAVLQLTDHFTAQSLSSKEGKITESNI